MMESYTDALIQIASDSPAERRNRQVEEKKLYGRSKYSPHIGAKQRAKGLARLKKEAKKITIDD